MKGIARYRLALLALAMILAAARPACATIQYSVSVAHPEKHVFLVTMRIPDVHDHVILQMPAWNALYQIRDFAAHMMQVSAKDDSGAIAPIEKLDKQTWQVTASGSVNVNYPIYWDEPGPFNSQLNADHAFVNLAMILLYIPDRRGEDTQVSFEDLPQKWRVAIELGAAPSANGGAPAYVAPNYHALVDAPAELGQFDELHIQAGGRPIRVVLNGDIPDRSKLTNALTRIVDYETSLMGGAPFQEYLFLLHVGSYGELGGGMEHANGTAIFADNAGELPLYCAHEFFHTWNVKRIRPQSLEPVDYTKEMWTRALWFAEGVTDTYESYTLVRTGLWSPQQFYANLAGQINELEARPAHRWQSAEQSSLDAWFEKYPLYLRPEESISYYNKGELLGFLLDIMIRDSTANRASLDDLMRLLNEEYAKRGRFYNDSQDLRAAAERVIAAHTPDGKADLGEFFRRYVAGTDELPYEDLLGRAGLELKNKGRTPADGVEKISEAPQATELQRRIREGLLRGATN